MSKFNSQNKNVVKLLAANSQRNMRVSFREGRRELSFALVPYSSFRIVGDEIVGAFETVKAPIIAEGKIDHVKLVLHNGADLPDRFSVSDMGGGGNFPLDTPYTCGYRNISIPSLLINIKVTKFAYYANEC